MAKTLVPHRENLVLGLTWPIFIELLLQLLVSSADQAMVSGVDPDGVGAIGNASQVVNLMLLVFSVVCTASIILISQHIGARDTKSVAQTYTVSAAVNLALGLAVSLLLVLGGGVIFRLMGVREEFLGRAVLYLRIAGWGMVFQAVYLTFAAFFRSAQMMKETMLVSLLMGIMSIGGNYVLINGLGPLPALGVAGAAISSLCSRAVGAAALVALFYRRFGAVIRLAHLRPFPMELLRRILRIGLPAGGESISYNLSQVSIQTVCNRFAAFAVNTKVYAGILANLCFLFSSAMSLATQVAVARLAGAGDAEGTDRQVRRTMLCSLAVSGTLAVLMAVLCRPLFGLFTKDEQVLRLAQMVMLIQIPLELGRAVNMTMCRALQACGDTRAPMVIGVIGTWLAAVGGSLILGIWLNLGLVGVWVSMAADECLRSVFFLLRWRGGQWKAKRI